MSLFLLQAWTLVRLSKRRLSLGFGVSQSVSHLLRILESIKLWINCENRKSCEIMSFSESSARLSWTVLAPLLSRVVFWWLEFILEPSITSMKIIFVFFWRFETNACGNELILDKWQTGFLLTCRTVTVNLVETDCSTTLSFKKIRFSISNWNFCHAWRRGMVIWVIWLAVPSPRFCNFDHHTNLFANDIISFRDNNLDL